MANVGSRHSFKTNVGAMVEAKAPVRRVYQHYMCQRGNCECQLVLGYLAVFLGLAEELEVKLGSFRLTLFFGGILIIRRVPVWLGCGIIRAENKRTTAED